MNSYGNKWLKLEDGNYTLAEKMEKRTLPPAQPRPEQPSTPPAQHQHTKGKYLFCEEIHPHYVYYECAVCGQRFTDGSTEKLDSCTTCNPPKTWGAWSGWSATPVYASATRQVETREVKVSDLRREYRYGRYVADGHDCWCGRYLEGLSYVSGSASLQYSPWSPYRYGTSGKAWSCGRCGASHIGVDHTGSDGRDWWAEYLLPDGSYYWEEARTIPAEYQTEYRYRDLR